MGSASDCARGLLLSNLGLFLDQQAGQLGWSLRYASTLLKILTCLPGPRAPPHKAARSHWAPTYPDMPRYEAGEWKRWTPHAAMT